MVITLAMLMTLPQKLHRTALCYGALLFGLLGFMMMPRPTLYVDTIRFFDTLDAARSYLHVSPVQAWDYLMNDQGYSATPVMGVIMYIVAIFRQNGWLTFIAATADIGAGFYLIHRQALVKKYSSQALVTAVFFFLSMFNFNAGVSGVRSYMACGLSVCLIYHYAQQGFKPIAAVWYLLLILIHPFASIAPFLYILSTTIKKHKIIYTIFCITLLFQQRFQDTVFRIFGQFSSIPFFASLDFKSTQYFGETAYIESSSVSSRIRDILVFSFLIVIIIESFRHEPVVNLHYTGFLIMLTSFGFGAFSDEQLFTRTTVYLLFAALPFVYSLFTRLFSISNTAKQLPIIAYVIMLDSAICLIDNLRAGVRFQYIQLSWTSLCIACFIAILSFCHYTTIHSQTNHHY
ncbi:hypothetical protein WM019_03410 [Bifidobacterium mongoliense]|uniref:EpsG family protein n=1 Tax=Bifidobacterium mongoliense TaxID=518643 RepID=UPI0030EC33F7